MICQVCRDECQLALDAVHQVLEIGWHNQEALQRIVEIGGKSLHSAACTLMRVDLANDTMTLVACWPCDGEFHRYMAGRTIRLGDALGPGTVDASAVRAGQWLEFHDLRSVDHPVVSRKVAIQFGFGAALGCPVWVGGQLVAYLNHFLSEDRPFSDLERRFLDILGHRVVAALEADNCKHALARYGQLSKILEKVDEAHTVDEALQIVFDSALALTGAKRGWVSRLDPADRKLSMGPSAGGPAMRKLDYGQGITGLALRQCRAVRADDVREAKWRGIYVEFWPDTVSELAVPIFIPNAAIRKGCKIAQAPKRIGVINLESPRRAAFSPDDEVLLNSLARHAAVVIDRMDLDAKLAALARVQQQIIGKEDAEEIVRIVTDAIAGALRYDYVNVSAVRPETRIIETEHVIGLPQGSPEEFKRLARHHLDRDRDIQCAIVASRQIEVPEPDDPRFDPKIYRAFGHDRLIRVFMPMIAASTDRVIGTIDAGYQRAEWQHIYEEDVRILKQFVDYAAEALERKRRGILDEITHELRAPVVGIRSNISYLERNYDKIDREFMLRKFEDILADCELVLYQVKELEYFLGRPPQRPKVERTLVFRDVIIAAIQQLKSELRARGFDLGRIEYNPDDIRRLGVLYVDRTQLKQVVFNLLLNAIKYAEDDPGKFTIRIGVETTREDFVISFKDWGIGIRDEYADRVFDSGFRTPEAIERSVSGSGLGLTISRRIMREMGGDLRLVRNRKPTEFHMILPKRLQEEP